MAKIRERTIEITNYCPFGCSYCSSDSLSTTQMGGGAGQMLSYEDVHMRLYEAKKDGIELIHISGGEPMMNRYIGSILLDARELFGRGIILHTNLIPQIGYNPNVCEGVRIHAYMTPDQVDEVHILKRVKQGREARVPVPKVHCSSNWRVECQKGCDHLVIKPDNTVVKGPCRKFEPTEGVTHE